MSDDIPPGHIRHSKERERQDRREDRLLAGAILATLVFIFGLVLFLLKWLVSAFGGGPDLLGPAGSILLGILSSLLVIGFLAVISGDGLIGELPTALSGFLLLSVIFSILALMMI